MEKDRDLKKNGEGYSDPTAYKAIKKVDEDESANAVNADERFSKLLKTIFNICELSGFHIEGRIVVKDMDTGKIWR